MAEFLQETLKPHFNFWIYVILMLIGLWSVIAKKNLIKKLIGRLLGKAGAKAPAGSC